MKRSLLFISLGSLLSITSYGQQNNVNLSNITDTQSKSLDSVPAKQKYVRYSPEFVLSVLVRDFCKAKCNENEFKATCLNLLARTDVFSSFKLLLGRDDFDIYLRRVSLNLDMYTSKLMKGDLSSGQFEFLVFQLIPNADNDRLFLMELKDYHNRWYNLGGAKY